MLMTRNLIEREQTMAMSVEQIRAVAAGGPFEPTWRSLGEFRVPRWFTQARFGIFVHWGLYSVPAFGNEWYSRTMYMQGTPEFEHHVATYGPQKDFGYKDFIPLFTADKFDPEEWADLFSYAGAGYVFPVAEHHDGFQMYRSDLSRWNAFEMGPRRDLLGELKRAVEDAGMTFCTSSHRAEHWWFMGHGREFDSDVTDPMALGDFYWPAQLPEPDPNDRYAKPYPSHEFLDDWLRRTVELIDGYRPAALYFDWWIQHAAFTDYLKVLAAYYYNRGAQWGTEVAIFYKHDAFAFGSAIPEVERGGFDQSQPFAWQSDTAIANNSWCHTADLDYKTPRQIVQTLADVVSKNGNLLLNVGPRGDGSIPEEDRRILEEVGDWMEVNGAAIHGAKPWRRWGEGPTGGLGGQFNEAALSYTDQDFRFIVAGGVLHAIQLAPSSAPIMVRALARPTRHDGFGWEGAIKRVRILGHDGPVDWDQNEDGLTIRADGYDTSMPLVCKIEVE
ncbi:MAG: alpha-L-fucosidase [Propionibacteriaceae bacterium]|jgi:alpha-L-fucosidase|nr:alpha-L-fucosidase [Propionibacteriaceae bacterium]